MPTFSDLELENRQIPSLARTWQGWRDATNRALNPAENSENTLGSGNFYAEDLKKTTLSDCFTLLRQTYDIISLIIPCNEIDLYLEQRVGDRNGLPAAPTRHPYAHAVVSFGKVKSSLKPLWGLFSEKDEVCFNLGKGTGETMLLTPKQIHKYTQTELFYKLTVNQSIPTKIFSSLLLHQRLAYQDIEAINRIARSQNIPPRFSLGARHLLDIAVREFSTFALEERDANPVGYSGASGVIPTMPRGYTGYSGISGVSGYSGYSPSGRQGRIYPPLDSEARLESGIIPRSLAEGKAGEDIPEEEKRKDLDKWDLI